MDKPRLMIGTLALGVAVVLAPGLLQADAPCSGCDPLPDDSPADYTQQLIAYLESLPLDDFQMPGRKFRLLERLGAVQTDLEVAEFSGALDTVVRFVIPRLDEWVVNDWVDETSWPYPRSVREELDRQSKTLGGLILREMVRTPQLFDTFDAMTPSGYKYGLDYEHTMRPHYEIVRSTEPWEAFWEVHTQTVYPPPALPFVDFGSEMVVMAFMGTQTWLVGIEVTDVSTAGELMVVGTRTWGVEGPLPVTNSCHIVGVDATPAGDPVLIIRTPPDCCLAQQGPDCCGRIREVLIEADMGGLTLCPVGDDGKAALCHNDRTKYVDAGSVAEHIAHGDTCGACDSDAVGDALHRLRIERTPTANQPIDLE